MTEAANALLRRVLCKYPKHVSCPDPGDPLSEKKEVYFEGIHFSSMLQKDMMSLQNSLRNLEHIQRLLLTSPSVFLSPSQLKSFSSHDVALQELADQIELRALILEEQMKHKKTLFRNREGDCKKSAEEV